MENSDLIILALYFISLLAIAFYIGKARNSSEFFANGRSTGLYLSVAALVSTNVGAGTYVGIASAGSSTGISYAVLGSLVVVFGFLIISFFAPRLASFGRDNNAFTLHEFLRYHYDTRSAVAGAVCTISIYLFFLASQFLALSTLVSVFSQVELQYAIVGVCAFLVVYSAYAGVKGDVVTDGVNFAILTGVMVFVIIPFAIVDVGGISNLFNNIPSDFLSPTAFGGSAFLVLAVIFGAPTLLVAMEMWQRIFSASSAKTAQRAFQIGAIVNLVLIIAPSVLALAFYAKVGSTPENPDATLFLAMLEFLPSGFLGLGIAAALAAFVSTANTMLLVLSATVCRDVIPLFSRTSGEGSGAADQGVSKARWVTLAVGILGAAIALTIRAL